MHPDPLPRWALLRPRLERVQGLWFLRSFKKEKTLSLEWQRKWHRSVPAAVAAGKWTDTWSAAPRRGPCRHVGSARQELCGESGERLSRGPLALLNAHVATLTTLLSCSFSICFQNRPHISVSWKERIVTWRHVLLHNPWVRREGASSSGVLALLPAAVPRAWQHQADAAPRRSWVSLCDEWGVGFRRAAHPRSVETDGVWGGADCGQRGDPRPHSRRSADRVLLAFPDRSPSKSSYTNGIKTLNHLTVSYTCIYSYV